jgi:hypothetical protein
MRRGALALLFALFVAPAARAQDNTAEMLQRAIRFYEDVQVERALALLRQVVSPGSPYEVSREQRVQAYKYLGAALAIQNMRDSAIVYFRAAIERDPATDLDPQKFSPVELSTFAEAKRRTFGIAARPIVRTTIDPRVDHFVLGFLTTHAAAARAEIRPAGSSSPGTVLFDGENDGVRELSWPGTLTGGRLAPGGRYEFAVFAQSQLSQRRDSARVYFELVQEHGALEDTLPSLRPEELLPERHPPSAGRRDLAKGLGIALTAMVMPTLVGKPALNGDRGMATTVATVGAAAGAFAFFARRNNMEIPQNIATNRRREAARTAANNAIQLRNNEKLALTRLVISPAAGAGQ